MVVWKNTTEFSPAPIDLASYAAGRDLTLPPLDGDRRDPVLIVDSSAWEDLWSHARSADVEVGGLLVGEVFQDEVTERPVTLVRAAIPALGGASSSASFTFTPAAWDHLTSERDQFWPEMITVGWFHTHPNLGVFYSGTDRTTQHAFFNRPWNIGIVVDPFAWSDQVGLFVGANSSRLPFENIVIAPDLVPVASGRPPVTPAVLPSPSAARTAWEVYGPRVAAAAVGTAAAVVAAVVARRIRTQRWGP